MQEGEVFQLTGELGMFNLIGEWPFALVVIQLDEGQAFLFFYRERGYQFYLIDAFLQWYHPLCPWTYYQSWPIVHFIVDFWAVHHHLT